jgi:hypothetical protein
MPQVAGHYYVRPRVRHTYASHLAQQPLGFLPRKTRSRPYVALHIRPNIRPPKASRVEPAKGRAVTVGEFVAADHGREHAATKGRERHAAVAIHRSNASSSARMRPGGKRMLPP